MDYQFYDEAQPERAFQGNFASGDLNFIWKTDERTTWNPCRTYIKIRLKITKGDGTRITNNFGLGLNMFTCDNLFQQMSMRVNGELVSEMNDYVAQCGALKYRLSKDMNDREELLSSINSGQVDLMDRIAEISLDGNLHHTKLIEKVATLTRAETFAGAQIDEGADTLAVGAGDGILTWVDNAGADLDLRNATNLNVGDEVLITLDTGIGLTSAHTITAINQLTLVISPPSHIGAIAGNVANNAALNIRKITSGKLPTQKAEDVELIWKPPLGFFDINDNIAGEYHFKMTPHAEGVWQKYAVEGITDLIVGDLAANYKIDITEINMYIWKHVHPSPVSGQKSLSFTEINCSSQNLTTTSLAHKSYEVHPKTHSLTIAFQDAAVGDDITKSRTKFRIRNDEQNSLVRYYIIKDGITLPQPIPSVFKSIDRNNMTQRYYENYGYSGGDMKLLRKEGLREWFEAGPYFHYKWGKGYRSSDLVKVYTNFSLADFTKNPQILMFDHYTCTVNMSYTNGKITSIQKSR